MKFLVLTQTHSLALPRFSNMGHTTTSQKQDMNYHSIMPKKDTILLL